MSGDIRKCADYMSKTRSETGPVRSSCRPAWSRTRKRTDSNSNNNKLSLPFLLELLCLPDSLFTVLVCAQYRNKIGTINTAVFTAPKWCLPLNYVYMLTVISNGIICFSNQLNAVSAGFTLVLDPRRRLGWKVGSACEESEDNKGGIYYWVNVSESSGARFSKVPKIFLSLA